MLTTQALDWVSSQDTQEILLDRSVKLEAEVRTWPPDNSALVADFASPTARGRITLWGTGDCEVEVLRIVDAQDIYRRSLAGITLEEFKTEFTPFLDAMAA